MVLLHLGHWHGDLDEFVSLKKNNFVLSRRGVPFLGIPKDNSRCFFKLWLMLVKLSFIVGCNWISFISYHYFPYSLLCPLKALYPIPVFHLPLKNSKCHFQSDNMEMSFPDWNYCFPLLSMILISGATWARSICLALISSLCWNSFLQYCTVWGAICP